MARWVWLLVVWASASAGAQEVVKLGWAGSTTGPLAAYGIGSANAARMAVEEINARGLQIGGRRVKLELIAEDDASSPQQATYVAQKLCEQRVSGVVGHIGSGASLAASRIYEKCGIPQISATATAHKLTHQGFGNVFRLLPNDRALGEGLALIASRSGAKRVAVVAGSSDYSRTMSEAFGRTAKSKGMELVQIESVADDDSNVSSIVGRLDSGRRPDAIFLSGSEKQARLLFQELGNRGGFSSSTLRVYGGSELCSERTPSFPMVESIVCTDATVDLNRMPMSKAWADRYRQKTQTQASALDAYSFDAVNVLIAAMVQARSSDPRNYLSALQNIEHAGVTGRIAFNQFGDLRQPTMSLYSYSRNSPGRADAPGTPCPDPCPAPAGLGRPTAEEAPAIPPGCCGTPK